MGIFVAKPDARRSVREFVKGRAAFVAAVTNTTFIGKDGGGLEFFATKDKRGEVFIHDPGAGQFEVIADSRDAFARMDALVDRWDRYADPRGVDIEELTRAEKAEPAFRDFRRRALALLPHVSLTTGSDYDATLRALAGKSSRLRARSDAESRYRAMKWLMLLFIDRDNRAPRLEYGRKRRPSMTRDPLYALWHAFLYAPDTFDFLRLAKDSDVLVRSTAQSMSRAVAKSKGTTLERLALIA
jgi:hypothetical protein